MTLKPDVPKVPRNEGGRGRPFKHQDKVTISWPKDEMVVWKDFLAAMKRDGWSASEIIRHWTRQYLQDHPLGNPQTPLERYEDPSKPLPHKHLWRGHSDDFGVWYTCEVPNCEAIMAAE